jgi:saposin
MIEVPDILPIDKEQIMSSKIPVPATRGHPVCSTCENILNKAVSYLSEKQTQDDIMEILHGACSQTFSLEQKVSTSIMPYHKVTSHAERWSKRLQYM